MCNGPGPAPHLSPQPSTSRNDNPSARPPILYHILMGRAYDSSEEESDNDFILGMSSSDEGASERETPSASASASSSTGGPSQMAPMSPHAPRPGQKIEMHHALLQGVIPQDQADPGNNACLYKRAHTQALLGVVACKDCGGDLTITRHGTGFSQYDRWHCQMCGDLMATKHPRTSGCHDP